MLFLKKTGPRDRLKNNFKWRRKEEGEKHKKQRGKSESKTKKEQKEKEKANRNIEQQQIMINRKWTINWTQNHRKKRQNKSSQEK